MSVNTYIFTAPMTFNRVLLVLSGQVNIIHMGRQGRVKWGRMEWRGNSERAIKSSVNSNPLTLFLVKTVNGNWGFSSHCDRYSQTA